MALLKQNLSYHYYNNYIYIYYLETQFLWGYWSLTISGFGFTELKCMKLIDQILSHNYAF